MCGNSKHDPGVNYIRDMACTFKVCKFRKYMPVISVLPRKWYNGK